MGILLRFYGVGVLNAATGYSIYAIFLFLGVNIFAAQITSHLLGMAFNYVMFRRHVFKDSQPAVRRFILAYAVNYMIGLSLVVLLRPMVKSTYLVGFLAMVGASLVNFIILKFAVFRPRGISS